MTDDMIEQVARAMCDVDGGSQEVDVQYYRDMARAAIEAMREPTDEMLPAEMYEKTFRHIWQKMIGAALKGDEG
jgi:hypothetical protein